MLPIRSVTRARLRSPAMPLRPFRRLRRRGLFERTGAAGLLARRRARRYEPSGRVSRNGSTSARKKAATAASRLGPRGDRVDRRACGAPHRHRRSGARGPAAPRRSRRLDVSARKRHVPRGERRQPGADQRASGHARGGAIRALPRAELWRGSRAHQPRRPPRPRASSGKSRSVLHLWRSGPGAVSGASRVRGGWRG